MDEGALQKPSPPRSLSRSDVVARREWRRCIHESRWCSPTERCWERGDWGGGERETGGLMEKAGRGGDKEMGVEKEVTERDRRRGGMWEGTDWWMNVCACRGEANANLPHQVSVSNWSDVQKETGGGRTRFQSSPLFSSSNASWVEFEKDQNKLNKLLNRCLRVVISHIGETRCVALLQNNSHRCTLDYSWATGAE